MKRVFISYCHEDGDFADNVRRKLEELGVPIWQDTDLYGGQHWRAEIDLAIRDAPAIILILSPEAVGSAYVSYEWAFALGVGLNVIPVLLRAVTEEMHPALESRHFLDFTNRSARPWELLFRAIQGVGPAATQTTIRIPLNAPPVLEQAVRGLDSLDEKQRESALETLEKMSHPDVVEVLAGAVHHPIREVRIRAGIELVRRTDKRGLPSVFEGLRVGWSVDLEYLTRVAPLAVPELLEALNDPDNEVRDAAANALGQSGEVSVIPHLERLLEDKEGSIRRTALRALSCYRGSLLLPIFEKAFRGNNQPETALRAAREHSGAAAEPLVTFALEGNDREARQVAAVLLKESATPAAVPALCRALRDSDDQVRISASQALASLADASAAPALLEALDDENSIVRDWAARALAKLNNSAIRSGLRDIVRNADRVYRDGAARLLGELRDLQAVPILIDALQDADTRQSAAEALGKIAAPGSPAVAALVTLMPRLPRTVVEALQRIADPATVDVLGQALSAEDVNVRRIASEALRQIGTPEARRTLASRLREMRGS